MTKLTEEQKKEIRSRVGQEGFHYYFRFYTDEDFGDMQYKHLREEYLRASKNLEDYLEECEDDEII